MPEIDVSQIAPGFLVHRGRLSDGRSLWQRSVYLENTCSPWCSGRTTLSQRIPTAHVARHSSVSLTK